MLMSVQDEQRAPVAVTLPHLEGPLLITSSKTSPKECLVKCFVGASGAYGSDFMEIATCAP